MTNFNGEVSEIFGAKDVDENGFVGVFLHEGDMLVGSGVVDYLGMVFGEDFLHALSVFNVGDDKFHVVSVAAVGFVAAELELEVVHG